MNHKKLILIILSITIFVKQLAWVTFIPLWQTPDEQAHFGQVQLFAETGGPKKVGNNLSKDIYISEVLLGVDRDQFGNNKFTYHPNYNIPYTDNLNGEFEQYINTLPPSLRTDMVKVESTGYPPLYYGLGAIIYKIFYFSGLIDRVFAVRLMGIAISMGITLISYQLGKKIFNQNRPALCLAILVGFMPMLSFVQSGVTSDSLFNLLFTLFIYLCVNLIDSGLKLKSLTYIVMVVSLSFMTKPQANIMFFILFPLLIFVALRDREFAKINKKAILAIVGTIAVLGISLQGILQRVQSGVSLIPETTGREITFSIEKIVEHLIFTAKHTYAEVLPWYWGVFRWLSLGLPEILRKITNFSTFLSFAAAALYFIRQFLTRRYTRQFQMLVFCAFSIVVYFSAITAFDYSFRLSHGFSFGIQGRYFFPVLLPQMVIFLTGLTFLIKSPWQGRIASLLTIGMIVLNIVVFLYLASSYYSASPLQNFFIQASQYKPIWLKYPVNLLILIAYLISSGTLALIFVKTKEKAYETK